MSSGHPEETAAIRAAFERSLGSLGESFWRQGVEPHFNALGHAWKEDFEYRINLIDLAEPAEVPLDGEAGPLLLNPSDYRRLHIRIQYTFHVAEPVAAYSVGCVFASGSLPAWFGEEQFFLRELVEIPELSQRERLRIDSTEALAVAQSVFDVELTLDGSRLEPSSEVLFSHEGARWSFPLSPAQRRSLTDGADVLVSVATFQPRAQRYYPANITTPTLGAGIEFNYTHTDIEHVHAEPFFSTRHPYASRLVDYWRPPEKGVTIRPRGDDWVFVGDGCVFVW